MRVLPQGFRSGRPVLVTALACLLAGALGCRGLRPVPRTDAKIVDAIANVKTDL